MNSLDEKIKSCERVWAEVDLDAILHNIRYMREGMREESRLMAVIKTDGYGHGSIPIARCLEPLDPLFGFAVATPEEAFILRESGVRKPILILGYSFPYAYERMAREEVRPAVFRADSLEELAGAARKAGKKIKIHIKVDTGMGRIGVTPDREGLELVKKAVEYVHSGDLEIEGIFTHFARADEYDKSNAREQLTKFNAFVELTERELGIRIPLKHCSNSAGILELPEANLDMVRAGITLYGLMPSDEVPGGQSDLRPALSLYSRIVFVKTIQKGQSVSYGGTFTAERETRVATVPVGYGDGYPRSLSGGKGYVLIRGRRAPIIGRVCMDQFMADVTEIPQAETGDRVTLIGSDGAERVTAETLGELSGRFNYELVCDLGRRIPRVYYQDGRVIGVQDHTGYQGK